MACTGSRMHSIDPRAKLIVTVIYIVAVLSFSLDSPAGIILFWVFPIIVSAMSGISYNAVFVKSLYTLPFIMFIGIFNPIFNREPMLYIGDMAISRSCVTSSRGPCSKPRPAARICSGRAASAA